MPKYTTNLSARAFRQLADDIRKYRLDLQKKCEEFTKRLSEIGLEKAKAILTEHVETGATIGSLRIEDDSNESCCF